GGVEVRPDFGDGSISLASMKAGDQGSLIGFAPSSGIQSEFSDPNVRLRIIYYYADVMRGCFDVSDLVNHLLDALFKVIRPDRGAVLLKNRNSGAMEPVASRVA